MSTSEICINTPNSQAENQISNINAQLSLLNYQNDNQTDDNVNFQSNEQNEEEEESFTLLNELLHPDEPKADYDKIMDIFNRYNKDSQLEITNKRTPLNYLYVFFHYYPKTELNLFNSEIIFVIIISPLFPEEPPQIKCKSNFDFPTLYDNSNLLENVLGYKWRVNSDELFYLKVLDNIAIKLNLFVLKLYENKKNKTLVYYGNYIKNNVYLMNDFMENTKINFYRVIIYKSQKEKEWLYAVLTHLYFLIFRPVPKKRGEGQLIKIYNLIHLQEYKEKVFHRGKKRYSVILKFAYGVEVNVLILNKTLESFIDLLKMYQTTKNSRYRIIQYEQFFEEYKLDNKIELRQTIEFKEQLLSQQKNSYYLKEELLFLYQQMIELANNDQKITCCYLDKINKLICLDKNKPSQTIDNNKNTQNITTVSEDKASNKIHSEKNESKVVEILNKYKEEQKESLLKTVKKNDITIDDNLSATVVTNGRGHSQSLFEKRFSKNKNFNKNPQNIPYNPVNTGKNIQLLVSMFSGNNTNK